MDLVIFTLLIAVLSFFFIWSSNRLMRIKPTYIFIPSIFLWSVLVILIILTYQLDPTYTILTAAFSFVVGPAAFVTLIYALNHYFNFKNKR